MKKKRHSPQQFSPDHPGTQPRESDSNKGKTMNTKSRENPDYVPDKGK